MVNSSPECGAEIYEVCYDCGCFVDAPKLVMLPSPNSSLMKQPKGYENMAVVSDIEDRLNDLRQNDLNQETPGR